MVTAEVTVSLSMSGHDARTIWQFLHNRTRAHEKEAGLNEKEGFVLNDLTTRLREAIATDPS